MSQFLIVILVQLLLVLICVVSGIAFYNYRRRHEEELGAQMLVYHINSHKDLRIDSLTALIEKVYGSQGEELKSIVDQLYLKEADCYRELIQVFMNRDPKQLPKMYDAVQKITAAYEGMLLQFNSDSKDQVGFTKKSDHVINNNFMPNNIASPSTPAATANIDKSVNTMMSATTEAKDNAKDLPLTYQQDPQTLSTDAMEVKVTDVAPEPQTQANVAPVDEHVATNSNAEVINDKKPAAAPNPEALPTEQEMSYYQDKLMTYLESKEVSKSAVTEGLDKDNQKEVAE